MDVEERQRRLQAVWCSMDQAARWKFKKAGRFSTDASFRLRARAVLCCMSGLSCREVARRLGCSDWLVRDAVGRFLEEGPFSLFDERRLRSGPRWQSQRVADLLLDAVLDGPRAFQCGSNSRKLRRLSWLLEDRLRVRVSRSTVWRWLRFMGIVRVRPKRWVASRWSKAKVQGALRRLVERVRRCGPHELVVFVDESELHLNSRGGFDWCFRGSRRWVRMPGQDRRLYLALAVEHGSRRLTSVSDVSKRCGLFLRLLGALLRRYRNKRRIHVVLDNASIHKARAVQRYLAELDGRIQLWFLPPFCPDANPVEQEWQAFHSAVSVLHEDATL